MSGFSQTEWEALKPLLDELSDLAPADRTVWLERRQAAFPHLAEHLAELVARQAQLDGAPFLAEGPLANAPPISSLAGQTLAGYVLERELGQGGMGSVWLGRRADGRYEGFAAIKFLTLAVAGVAGEARFRREGSVLARLSHPNIARLLDAGITPAGQPYLVLEYVEGQSLDAWCDQRRSPVKQRLELFQQVLGAVAYTHEQFIVHRDLKPANIMVTADGTIKLLDFGIAKLLEDSGRDPTALTGSREAVLTFRYAAPEQILGEPITAATDVYSLGVILYELLTGQHPTNQQCHTPAEHVRAIIDTEPTQLSRVVTSSAAVSREVAVQLASARAASPEGLGRSFAGDLDNILARALQKVPAQRYSTVRAFADDIERHLSHQPIAARGASLAYRTGRFMRRHRIAVTAGVLVLLSLVGGIVSTASQAREARRQRDAAYRETERQGASRMVQSMMTIQTTGPEGKPLTTAERVALAVETLQRQYADRPWLIAEGMVILSTTLYEVGNMAAARTLLVEAQDVARAAQLPDELAEASCHRVYVLVYDDFVDSARMELAGGRQAMGRMTEPDEGVEAACRQAEARVLLAEGKADSAIPLLRQNVEQTGRAESGPLAAYDLAEYRDALADALRAAGRTREAATEYLDVLRALDAVGYSNTVRIAAPISLAQGSLKDLGEFVVAESAVAVVVRQQEQRYGSGQALSEVSFLYGNAKLFLESSDSADLWIARSLRDTTAEAAIWASRYIPPAMARLRLDQHRPAEALPFIARIHADTRLGQIYALWNRARVRWELHDQRGAIAALEEGIRQFQGDGPSIPPALAPLLVTDGEWRLAVGDFPGADSVARRARVAAAIDSLALSHSAMVGRAETVLARALAQESRPAEALRAAERALVATSNGYGPHHPRTEAAARLRDSLKAIP